MPANRPSQSTENDPTGPILVLLLAACVIIAVLWAGAELAAYASHRVTFPPSNATIKHFVTHLPDYMGDPKLAWPPEVTAILPGPVLYWTCTAIVMMAVTAIVITIVNVFRPRREDLDTRSRLGTTTNAQLATKRDLIPLLSKTPTQPGRLVLGRFGRRFLLTEIPNPTKRSQRRLRRNGRGAVMILGPSRSGKSTLAIEQILNWDGPAVVVSVKGDLLNATLQARGAVGEVKSFDPSGHTRLGTSKWSPLRNATSISGAMHAASQLVKAAPSMGTVEGGDHWSRQAETLLSAMLGVAAYVPELTMADVSRWITTQDMPNENSEGEITPILRRMCIDHNAQTVALGEFSKQTLLGLWRKDPRSISPVYATASNIVWPWLDPIVGTSADGCDIDLDWLMAGRNNTLYVNTPLADQGRMNSVLGGLLGDIVNQVTQRNVSHGPLNKQLLILIDEAGNIRLDDLPEWASVLAVMGVQLVTVWQSLAQIRSRYKDRSDTLITNHITKVWFPGMSDLDGLRYASTLGGDEHVPATLSRWRGQVPDDRIPTTGLPLLDMKVLREMQPGNALLQHGSLPSARVKTFSPRTNRSRRFR